MAVPLLELKPGLRSLVRSAYGAFNTADIEAPTKAFDESASWYTPGRSPIAGERRGEDAVDRQIEVKIEHLSGDIAGVTCLCHRYVDLLHLIRMPEGWKIVNAAWQLR